MKHSIFLPDANALVVREEGKVYRAGCQEWFDDKWKRQAGCGPTNCANLLRYLAVTWEGCEPLCRHDATQKAGFVQLMEDVWPYVTPGNMGVNTTDIFVDGARRYGEEKGVPLAARVLNVGPLGGHRDYEAAADFVADALKSRLPVAFLNLTNGKLKNLHRWHWVTLVALRGDEALMYDYGAVRWINLRQWLDTSALGGGFVALEPAL